MTASRMTLTLALGAVLLAPAGAQSKPSLPTLDVSATGTAETQPDTAVIAFEIRGQNPQVAAAYSQAQTQAEALRTLLAAHGFLPVSVRWSSYQVQPNVDYRTRRVTDYSVTVSAQLEITDFTRIEPLVEATGTAGMTSLASIGFELRHPESAKANAIADGYRQAQREAESLAAAAGERLGPLVHASVDVSASAPVVRSMGAEFQAMAAPPAPMQEFTPGSLTVTARVQATYQLQP